MRWLVAMLVCLTFINSQQSFAAGQRMELRHTMDALRQMGPKFCRNPGGLRDVMEIHLQNLGSRLWPLLSGDRDFEFSHSAWEDRSQTTHPQQCAEVRHGYAATRRAFERFQRQVSRFARIRLPTPRCERMFERSLVRVSSAVETLKDSYPEAYQVKDQPMAFHWRPQLPTTWKEREDEFQSWRLDSFSVHTFSMNGVEWDLKNAPLDVNVHQDDLAVTVKTLVSLTDLCLGSLEMSVKGEATLRAEFEGATEYVTTPVNGLLTFQPDSRAVVGLTGLTPRQ